MTAEITIEGSKHMGAQSNSYMNFKDGYYYYFDDEGDEIVARCSSWSGMETIYINGEKVSQHRNLGFNSKHKFAHGGSHYQVIFIVSGMMKGALECLLLKDDRLIGNEYVALSTRKGNKWIGIGMALLGFALGVVGASVGLSFTLG